MLDSRVELCIYDLPHSTNKHHLWDGICLVMFDAQRDSFFHPEENK